MSYTSNLDWTLLDAAKDGFMMDVEDAVDAGANVNCTTNDGWTPLLEAVVHDPEIVEYLLSKGADPDIASEMGYTPLMRAAGLGKFEVVKILIEAGADIYARDMYGQTARDMAMAESYPQIASYLQDVQNIRSKKTAKQEPPKADKPKPADSIEKKEPDEPAGKAEKKKWWNIFGN